MRPDSLPHAAARRLPLLRRLRQSESSELPRAETKALKQILRRSFDGQPPLDDVRRLVGMYHTLSAESRLDFVRLLAAECAVAEDATVAAAREILESHSTGAARAARAALEPPYLPLMRQFRAVEGGAAVAVEIRAALRSLGDEDPSITTLDEEIRDLLAGWFDPASFELRRVTWDAPASLLETLASLESVHAVRGWDDLKNRVDTDRRFYALFHPLLGDRPVAFTQIAITRELTATIASLLDPTAPTIDPATAETAVFYSISATQKGLSGLRVGETLIERAIAELRTELPHVKTFATLSPLPGFVRWLTKEAVDPDVAPMLEAAARGDEPARDPLLRLAAQYLLSSQHARGASDPVANFHLGNGARIERLNWQADLSDEGLQASAGIMVNYVYALRDRGRNRASYLGEGTIAASAAVTKLAGGRATAAA